jgi:AAA ATPase domain
MTELAAVPNPFRDNVVQDAWQSPATVADIHLGAFNACLAGIASARGGVPDSLLIYGPAGSGKTHLLTRLQRHLAQTARDAPDQVLGCVFVFVRLQTAPQLLWQHLRKRLATDLMQRDQGLTQLQRLIAHQIAVRAGKSPRAAVFRVRVLEGDDQAALSEQLAELTARLSLPRDLSLVIEHLTLNRSVRDATAWLSGESLPESALAQLGLGPDGQEDREQAARETVTALCRLAGETLPIVFCFDQVEALQRSSDDKEAFFRFGQMAADLHDTDPNVFLVTCLQSAALTLFRDAIRDADRERMAKRHAVLDPLSVTQVEQLVRSRLDSAPELAALRRQRPAEPFYPFSPGFIRELSADPTSCVPRAVLSKAARRFEELQHHAIERIDTSEFLATELFLRKQAALPELSAADTTRLVIQGSQLLAKLEGHDVSERDAGRADLVLGGRRAKVALSVRNEADGRSLGPKLKALLDEHPRKDKARLVIVRDPRLTIAKTAVKTREHLAKLQASGAVVVEPTLAALAALEALQSIISDAKSGDLANDGEPVQERTVLSWLESLKDDVLLEPMFELFDALMTEDARSPQRPEEQDLADLLAREHVLELDVLSQRLGHAPDLLLRIARQNIERYLVLEGPPVVLLDVAGTSAEGALA